MHRSSSLWGVAAGAVGTVLIATAVPGVPPARRSEKAAGSRAAVTWTVREVRCVGEATRRGDEGDHGRAAPHAKETETEESRGPRLFSAETAAIATLRNLISAQSQFRSTARADENNNGVGEYGSFGELSGAAPVRDGIPLNPPFLSPAFRDVAGGRVERTGYYFQIFLPRAGDRLALPELPDGGYEAGAVHADVAETTWCAYAWPADPASGLRTFFVNEEGDILATRGYRGELAPHPYAAFAPTSPGITGEPAVEARGQDGNVWKQAG
jgi:hypothetical protein